MVIHASPQGDNLTVSGPIALVESSLRERLACRRASSTSTVVKPRSNERSACVNGPDPRVLPAMSNTRRCKSSQRWTRLGAHPGDVFRRSSGQAMVTVICSLALALGKLGALGRKDHPPWGIRVGRVFHELWISQQPMRFGSGNHSLSPFMDQGGLKGACRANIGLTASPPPGRVPRHSGNAVAVLPAVSDTRGVIMARRVVTNQRFTGTRCAVSVKVGDAIRPRAERSVHSAGRGGTINWSAWRASADDLRFVRLPTPDPQIPGGR